MLDVSEVQSLQNSRFGLGNPSASKDFHKIFEEQGRPLIRLRKDKFQSNWEGWIFLKGQILSPFLGLTPQYDFYLESDRKMTARILQLAALVGLMLHATTASSINGTTLNMTKTPAVIVEPNPGNIFI